MPTEWRAGGGPELGGLMFVVSLRDLVPFVALADSFYVAFFFHASTLYGTASPCYNITVIITVIMMVVTIINTVIIDVRL